MAHAAPDYVEIVLPERSGTPGAPLDRLRVAPLIAWARRQVPVTLQRATVRSNRHGDGYQVVVLQRVRGFCSVGWECADALAGRAAPRVTKVYATREAVPWD